MLQGKKVLLTGSTGFIGAALYDALLDAGCVISTLGRQPPHTACAGATYQHVQHKYWDLKDKPQQQWCSRQNIVIHLAAASSAKGITQHELWQVNVDAPVNLYRQACASHCERFIFISSAQVCWSNQYPYTFDLYTQSKVAAEEALQLAAQGQVTQLIIIRPAMVYGPGVRGSFAKLQQGINKGLWLPFAGINNNSRSILALTNLVDFIRLCMVHTAAGQRAWDLADVTPYSTRALIEKTARAMCKPAKMFYVPIWLLQFVAVLCRCRPMMERLVSSAVIDSEPATQALGWFATADLEQQLKIMLPQNNTDAPSA